MTLYDALIEAGCAVDHHQSDLYVLVTPEAEDVIARFDLRGTPFISPIDKRVWLDIPFAYAPYWREKGMRA